MQKSLEVMKVGHSFGDKRVLNNINFVISKGQFVSLVGPSGCGKSTLLRAIVGTHLPLSGEIYANGIRVLKPSRDVGIVYQHYPLFDFMKADQNVAWGLIQDQTTMPHRFFKYFFGWKKRKQQLIEQSRAMLKKVGLESAIHDYPGQMSGGMRQRAAVARSLIMQPQILLMDEPFAALDEAKRKELQDMICDLRVENEIAISNNKLPPHTLLIVTHELNEAIYLSDRVIGLSQFHADGANGATIVYDKKATAFNRKSERDYNLFIKQKQELIDVVFKENKHTAGAYLEVEKVGVSIGVN